MSMAQCIRNKLAVNWLNNNKLNLLFIVLQRQSVGSGVYCYVATAAAG